ncbi:MAG: hypothetical protein P1Q69_00930 [Candidatus Thorarchaeota archaeon]|nr:hypothetical protein [Candidatus Thorarchaeota archaeon]
MLSDISYDTISKAWENEKDSKNLQDFEDLRLSKMVSYLSSIRQQLAEMPSDNAIQVDLLTQEGLNIEYMLRDLLMLRRTKIMNLVLQNETPKASMTLAEEEFHNRMQRGISSHTEFIDEVIAGSPVPTMKRTGKSEKPSRPEKEVEDDSEEMEYVMVRFLRAVEESFMGLDETVYGPFQEEDVATIPTANAKVWLRDGTVARVAPTK